MSPVAFGHVFGRGGKAAPARIPGVAGNALPTVENFQRGAGHPHFQRLAHQRVWDAVAVALKLDVVVDVDFDRLEHR